MNISGSHLSKEFFDLVKAIGESRSKQEEDRIIMNEISTLKNRINEPSVSPRKMKEFLIRGVYVEMLGHDASFCYIHAVNFTHEKNLLCKRMGYLACNLFLHRDHELMLLLINTIQRDLNSVNYLEVSAALTCVCRLVNAEMIPMIFPTIKSLLSHRNEIVRKKACLALYKLYKIQPQIIAEAKDYVRRTMCDPDPSVMSASLHIIHELAKRNARSCRDLVPSIVSILKQVCEHRLPKEYDYHRVTAPWLQIKLLSLLTTLGIADKKSCEQMYEVLQEVIRTSDVGVNVSYAIISECVKTITAIYPSHQLFELAASNISRFITAENHNLKYVGVTGLASIVQVNPSYAANHQLIVVDCLEDPDDTLKRKTLDLLFKMTNPQNVTVVVDKFLFHLKTSVDQHLRRDLTLKVTQLAERYAPNSCWYIDIINSLFEIAGALVNVDVAYNLILLIAEGLHQNQANDNEFRTYAVNTYVKLCQNIQNLPDALVQIAVWVLGEYGSLTTVEGYKIDNLIDLLCSCADKTYEDPLTRGWIITAITKLCAFNNCKKNNSVCALIEKYRNSQSTDIQQRCFELRQLLKFPKIMKDIFPYDAFCEDIQVDEDLSFLDDFIHESLVNDATPYIPVINRKKNAILASSTSSQKNASNSNSLSSLIFMPYESPAKHDARTDSSFSSANHNPTLQCNASSSELTRTSEAESPSFRSTISAAIPLNNSLNSASSTNAFQVQVPRRWGPSGYNKQIGNLNEGSASVVCAAASGGNLSKIPPGVVPHNVSSLTVQNTKVSSNERAKTSMSSEEVPQSAHLKALTEREKIAFALFSGVRESKSPASVPQSFCGNENQDVKSFSRVFLPHSAQQLGKVRSDSAAKAPSGVNFSSPPAKVRGPTADKTDNILDIYTHDSQHNSFPFCSDTSLQSSSNENDAAAVSKEAKDLLDLGFFPASQLKTPDTYQKNFSASSSTFVDTLDFADLASANHLESNKTKITDEDIVDSLSDELLLLDCNNTNNCTSSTLHEFKQKNNFLVTPLKHSIEQVSSKWNLLLCEHRLSLYDKESESCDSFMLKLKSILNIHIVQIIGVEGIAAGHIKNNDLESIIYLHCKVRYPSVNLLLKATDKKVIDAVSDELQQHFSLNK